VSITVVENRTFDLAALHVALSLSLREATSLEQFRNIAQVITLLLEKHGNSMTQVNVESTLAAVTTVCSFSPGLCSLPKSAKSGASVAGAVFDTLCCLTATVIKRHRLRLEGHHHLLVTTLQAMLRALVATPAFGASTGNPDLSSLIQQPPDWLDSRLKPRHAAKFARLLTLICEPSAASVAARGNHNKGNGPNAGNLALDSATDAFKRSAGQHMFRVLMTYVKLQLDEAGAVPRDVRKELDVGVYSVLSITPESCLRIMSEGMDASGRAIFRTMYADYKKFGKWSGV
jgi:nucleolar pre-ribosomal-associated protein 2